jgi:hypothetical protein
MSRAAGECGNVFLRQLEASKTWKSPRPLLPSREKIMKNIHRWSQRHQKLLISDMRRRRLRCDKGQLEVIK